MEELSTLILSRLQGLSQSQALVLLRYYGSASAALSDESPVSEHWDRLRRDRYALQAAREIALRELDFCEEHAIRVIPFGSEDYPTLLQADEIPDPPIQLFYRGTNSLNRRHVLSVVGTRHITEYGKQLCESFFAELSALLPDVLVISGLAYGVDIHVHREALTNKLDTIAVMAHGHDRIYPRLHAATAEEMTEHGGLLTEYFIGTIPDKGNFVRRNRIVAGLSAATLVVESAEQGGSLITASLASSYNREVLAFPGRVSDPYSAGCNRLIRENRASLVTSASDFLQQMGWESVANRVVPEPSLFPMYTPEQEKVLEALERADCMSADQLALSTGLTVARLSDLLFDLEDAQAIKRMPGNRFRLHG